MLAHPDHLTDGRRDRRNELTGACPEMIDLTGLVASFAELLRPHESNSERLDEWIATVRDADLPHLHAFTRGLDLDRNSVVPAGIGRRPERVHLDRPWPHTRQ